MRHSGSSQSTFLWQPTHHLWGLKWLKSRTSSNISCILAILWSFWRAAHISTFFSGLAFLHASFSCFSAWGCEGAGGETVAANTWGQLGVPKFWLWTYQGICDRSYQTDLSQLNNPGVCCSKVVLASYLRWHQGNQQLVLVPECTKSSLKAYRCI